MQPGACVQPRRPEFYAGSPRAAWQVRFRDVDDDAAIAARASRIAGALRATPAFAALEGAAAQHASRDGPLPLSAEAAAATFLVLAGVVSDIRRSLPRSAALLTAEGDGGGSSDDRSLLLAELGHAQSQVRLMLISTLQGSFRCHPGGC